MFSKLFGQRPTTKNKPPKKSSFALDASQAKQQEQSAVNHDAERQLYRYDMPTQTRGMTDLIQSHDSGNRFQYVALVGTDAEEHSSRIRRLIMLKPSVSKSEIPIREVPRLKLHQDSEKFPFGAAIPKKGKDFIMLNKATVIFTPLTSFADNFTVLSISILDMRRESDQVRQQVKANTNVQVKCEFSLDHCVPREDLDQISLVVSREIPHMSPNRMWGVIQVQLEMVDSDYPYMENMKEVVGVLSLPSTGLEKFDKDPMTLDITMVENHRKQLQQLYMSGEIEDETEPKKERVSKMTYSKSSAPAKQSILKSMPKSFDGMVNIEPDIGNWEAVRNAPKKSMISDDIASIDVPDDSDTSDSYRPPTPPKFVNKAEEAKSVKLEDMFSDTAVDSEEEILFEAPKKAQKKKQELRFANMDV
jgi:hypothetical protein